MTEIKVKLVRSRIGTTPAQRRMLDSLGLKRREMVKTFKDMWAELKKVTWPSRKDLIRQSTVVIVFVLILTVVVGLMDYVLSNLLRLIIS